MILFIFLNILFSNVHASRCAQLFSQIAKPQEQVEIINKKLSSYETYINTISVYYNLNYKKPLTNPDWIRISNKLKNDIKDKIKFLEDINSIINDNSITEKIALFKKKSYSITNSISPKFFQDLRDKAQWGNVSYKDKNEIDIKLQNYFPNNTVKIIEPRRVQKSISVGWESNIFIVDASLIFNKTTANTIMTNKKQRKELIKKPHKFVILEDGTIMIGADIRNHIEIAGFSNFIDAGYVRINKTKKKSFFKFNSTDNTKYFEISQKKYIYSWEFNSAYDTDFKLQEYVKDYIKNF